MMGLIGAAQAQFTASQSLSDAQIARSKLSGRIDQLRARKSYQEALSVANEMLAKDEDVDGKEHVNYAKSLQLVGELHREMGQLDEAENYLKQALGVADRLQERDSLKTVDEPLYLSVASLTGLGLVCVAKKEFPRAEKYYEEALSRTNSKADGKWSQQAYLLYKYHHYLQLRISQLHIRNGEYDKAEKVLRDGWQVSAAAMGPASIDYAEIGGLMGYVALKKGDATAALTASGFAAGSTGSLADRAYQVHLRIARTLRSALIRSDRKEQAEADGLQTLDKAKGIHVKALRSVAETYQELGKNDQAQNLLKLAERLEAFDPPGDIESVGRRE